MLLLVTVVFGILLIRGTLHEIRQRERIEKLATDLRKAYASLSDLNDHLEQKVAEQTIEVRAAYDVEKRARAELEKLNSAKEEFITTTQHHLRTPLTSLNWALESLRKHESKSKDAEITESIAEAESSAKSLREVIENFLGITANRIGLNN